MVNDVARAHFNAPSTKSVFMELCEEDRGPEGEGMCGELSVSMHNNEVRSKNLTDIPHRRATAVSKWLVGTRACWDIKNVTSS